MDMKKRDKEIEKMRREGMTIDEIAKMYGVTRARIHQIIKKSKEQDTPRDFDSLSTRVKYALIRAGIHNKEEFIAFYEQKGAFEVINIRNLGRKSIRQLEEITGLKILNNKPKKASAIAQNDTQKEIDKLIRIREKIDAQIRKLKCAEIDNGFFKVMAMDGEEESYEIGVKVIVDGENRVVILMKSPTINGVYNQISSLMNDLSEIRNEIFQKWMY